jgi:hypothetical protein
MKPRIASRVFLVLFTAGAILSPGSNAHAANSVEINSCGQVLEGGGYLSADLDCSGDTTDEPTLTVGSDGIVDLRGFTLTSRASEDVPTVVCDPRCTILGPGTIVGSPNGDGGVVGTPPYQWSGTRVEVIGATITGGSKGVVARRVSLQDAVISGNRHSGVWSFYAIVESSELTGNGIGDNGLLSGTALVGQLKARVTDSHISGNGKAGVVGPHTKLIHSTVTGNDADPRCTTEICADLFGESRPKLDSSSCDTSATVQWPGGTGAVQSWGVCDLD